MKLKVPVIASNVGGIPDIVINDQTGKLVEPKDSEAIYKQIMHLYNHRDEAEILSENAYQNTFNYTPETMTDAYFKLYLTL
jgi:glycosyltransferase involved in cell wall biosynthesis